MDSGPHEPAADRSRRPTQVDVAVAAGVSRALVSLVMRDAPSVAPGTRDRVLAAARTLGYRPNALARSLAQGQSRTVGTLIYDVTNPHLGAVYAAFARAADAHGIQLLVANGLRSAAREPDLVDTLLEHQIAGLALLSPTMHEDRIAEIAAATPVVVIGREASVSGIDVVTLDEDLAAQAILGHLTMLGHARIAHITGGRDNRPGLDRAAAYRRAMRRLGLTPIVVPGAFTPDGGAAGARALCALPELPTAVIAGNDLTAVGAMGQFASLGLRVPEDVSVVGYDDSQIARLDLIGLTTIRQPVDWFGELGATMILERMAGRRFGSRIERGEPTLVLRHTTAAPAR